MSYFKTFPKVKKNILCRNIDIIKPGQLSGKYEIQLTKADTTLQYYIGIMNTKFKTGIREHIVDIKYNRKPTDLAKLHNIEPFQIIFLNSKIIHTWRFYSPSTIHETI